MNGGVGSKETWAQLGAETKIISLSGGYSHVPEPAALALLAMGSLCALSFRRQK